MLVRAAVLGCAYGLAVSVVALSLGAQRLMALNMPPGPAVATRAALLQMLLGAMLGLLAAPLLRGARGWLWHLCAVVAVWVGLERFLAIDPLLLRTWLAAPVAGALLVLLGRIAARWWRGLPWIVAGAMVAAAIVVPVLHHASRMAARQPEVALGTPVAGAPDVVVIVLDTVRAANMSAYGYERETTPSFDALGADAMLFLDATAPSTWSLPSHASLFTGWFPSASRAHGEHRVLDDTLPTLAEVLRAAGYDTRCFTANPHISDSFGLTRGFAWSDEAWQAGAGGRSFLFVNRLLDFLGFAIEDKGGAVVADNFEQWIASRGPDARPAFAFLNFLEAHFPYHQVPEAFLRKFSDHSSSELRTVSMDLLGAQFGRTLTAAEIAAARPHARDMYDAGVLYSDHLLDRVVAALRGSGRLDETILVVLADHGEMLGEAGGFGHGSSLRELDLRVPLLVRYPPRIPAGRRIDPPVSTLGVYGTVLDLAGIAPTGTLQVGSLLPLLDDLPAGAPVIAERYEQDLLRNSDDPLRRADRRYRTYRSGRHKLVRTSAGETMLFDLDADPNERHDVAARFPDDVTRLVAELEDWRAVLHLPALDARLDTVAAPAVDAAAEERLRALGYVQ